MKTNRTVWLIPLRTIIFGALFPCAALLSGQTLWAVGRWWPVLATGVNLAVIALLLALTRGQYGSFIGYVRGGTRPAVIVAWVTVTIVVGVGGMYLAGLICYHTFPYLDATTIQALPIWAVVACVVLLPLTTTLAEDGIYLGVINAADGRISVTIASALFYAAQHSFLPFIPDPTFMVYRFMSFLPLTVIFTLWYRKRRNPLPIMAGHFVINLATVAMLIGVVLSPDAFTR